jgi:hypothetical protein
MKKTGNAFLFILWIILAPAITQKVNLTEANPYTPPEPAIPEFTLKYTDNSHNVAGNFVQNKSIEVTIKNQPTGYVLCYNVKAKSHSAENWTAYEYYNNSSYLTPQLFLPNRLLGWNSTTTILVFGFEGNNGSDNYNLMLGKVNDGDKIDFQIQAYIGNWFPGRVVNATASIDYWLLNIDATGDWSPIQTITIQENSIPEPAPLPEPFPTTLLIGSGVAVVAVVGLGLLVYFKKRSRNKSP